MKCKYFNGCKIANPKSNVCKDNLVASHHWECYDNEELHPVEKKKDDKVKKWRF